MKTFDQNVGTDFSQPQVDVSAEPRQTPSALDTRPNDFRRDVSEYAREAQAGNPSEQRRRMLEGTENVGALIGNRDFNRGLGFGNDAMLGAIEQRTRGDFSRSMRKFKHETTLEAYKRSADKLASASELVSQEIQLNYKAKAIKEARERAKKAARGALVGNILGIAGAVAGASTGNPAAATAGYQLGSAGGNIIGGQ